ncbi:MAG: helix-turn-helix transcriptional regulator [Oscillospiraceae bacterium]|nr:helix-turn-helix transcriptional regulator [Oscillospiraceae bacterium]
MEQTIGKRIMENRKRLGLTQDALAEQLGVTAQAVSHGAIPSRISCRAEWHIMINYSTK